MIRLAAVLAPALVLATACGQKEPPAWDAWLDDGPVKTLWSTGRVVDEDPLPSPELVIWIESSHDDGSREVTLRPDETWTTGMARTVDRPPEVWDWVRAGLTLRIPDGNPTRPQLVPHPSGDPRGLPGSDWPESLALAERAAVVTWWELGVAWIALAAGGGGETTMALPTTQGDVDVKLAIDPLWTHDDGTGVATARAVLDGDAAHRLAEVWLRELRESGDPLADAGDLRVRVVGTFSVNVELDTRRPRYTRTSWTMTATSESLDFESTDWTWTRRQFVW